MRVVSKLNNNVVLCRDGDGKQVIAIGKGLGFIPEGEEVDLARITRTFYDINPEGWTFLDELNGEIMGFAAGVTDFVRDWLPYPLSPNFAFILADHLAFAIKRMDEGIHVHMPLSYDVEQQYPEEYRIGHFILNRLAKTYDIRLPETEVTGIALCFANNALAAGGAYECHDAPTSRVSFDEMLERSVRIVEKTTGTIIGRNEFNFSRFATHLQYLYSRVVEGAPLEDGGVSLSASMRQRCPEVAEATDEITALFRDELSAELTDEEQFYLMLHVNRMCSKGAPLADSAGAGELSASETT